MTEARSRYEDLDPVQRALVDLLVDLVAARLEREQDTDGRDQRPDEDTDASQSGR